MAVIGQSHLIWRSSVADYISHGNTIVRIVPTEVGQCKPTSIRTMVRTMVATIVVRFVL